MSTSFVTAPSLQKLDPLKRVNYTFGLVLGVEEFVQSDTYFLAKHHVENRLLHSYGTVCGLDVVAQVLEVRVTPGWAINPRGQEINVPQLMCVELNNWLSANLAALQAALLTTAPPATLSLCVVLCSRECKTDTVPIPGEPCMTQSSSMAPSRIADSFDLMLCLDYSASPPIGSPPSTPPIGSPPSTSPIGSPPGTSPGGLCLTRPPQLEDDAIRALARLLSEFQVSATGPFLSVEQVEQLVLDLAQPVTSPPIGSPPTGPPYLIDALDAAELRRAALRTWITQVRPFICSAQGADPCCPPPEKCVLLAELVVNLTGGATEWIATNVSVDDALRPFLVPTGVLQEVLLRETAATSAAYRSVAAGHFAMTGAPIAPSFNSLSATPGAVGSNEFILNFAGYKNTLNYIVKGTVQGASSPVPATAPASTFEFVDFETAGIRIRIRSVSATPLQDKGFMAEITQIGGAS
jgi:hypothetical protein